MSDPNHPRSSRQPSLSELIPIRSGKISVLRSSLLLPGSITIAVGLVLFGLFPTNEYNRSNVGPFIQVLGAYLIFIIAWAIYTYARSEKPVVALLFPVAVVAGLLLFKPAFSALIFVFRVVLPGEPSPNAGFANQFIAHFFGAGLMEELVKGVPALIGLFLTLRPTRTPIIELIRVRGPLDGIVYGVVAGATFTFIETVLVYVPEYGFLLLFPRVFVTISGHIAYAGIFGYFIGLAAIRPVKLWPLLLTGWLSAAALHAIWNASAGISLAGWLSAGVTYLLFLACMLKARQLEGQQSHAQGGLPGSIVALGSIVAGPTTGSAIQTPSPSVRPHGPSRPPSVRGPSSAQPEASPAASFQLLVEGRIIPLRPGLQLDLGKLPGFAHGKGIVMAVTIHPKDPTVLGLQNLGQQAWTALHEGSSKQIDPQRNIRISHGTLIAFGSVQGSIQRIAPSPGETT